MWPLSYQLLLCLQWRGDVFLYQLLRQSSIVCICLVNGASSLGSGMKPIASRRTDPTKMVDTKHHCVAESTLGYIPGNSLFRVSLFIHEWFFFNHTFHIINLQGPYSMSQGNIFWSFQRKGMDCSMKSRQLSPWWLPKGHARPQALISGESRVTVIWESGGSQPSARKSLQDQLFTHRTRANPKNWGEVHLNCVARIKQG